MVTVELGVDPRIEGAATGGLVADTWRRSRMWLLIVAVLILGALLVGALSNAPGRALDPMSADRNGSKALTRVLAGYGIVVHSSTSLASVSASASASASASRDGVAVLVTSPDDYSSAQLRRLRGVAGRLVLVQPGTRATAAVAPGVSPDLTGSVSESPDCANAGANAAGSVNLPSDVRRYDTGDRSAVSCYGGALIVTRNVVLLGSSVLLQNDALGQRGVAALDVNALTADRSIDSVQWLQPGADADGSGPASIWDLFPDGAYRAFFWLIALGVLIVLWRGRRLGAVVREPLPVIVRAAEIIEGHGRLYERAGARDRAAYALRTAATARLASMIALPRGAGAEQVAAAVAPLVHAAPGALAGMLGGGTPVDDAALIRLATDLDRLETAVRTTRGDVTA